MSSGRNGLRLWLDRLLLRSRLTPGDCDAITALPGDFEIIRPSRDFVRLGEQVDHACLVVEGMAARFGQSRLGERMFTALHIAGDMADLHSVPLPIATTGLQTIGETSIYRVPHTAMRDLVSRSSRVAEALWRDCMVDAAILSQWALVNGRLPAIGRVAHLLAEMACRFTLGRVGEVQESAWPLNQEQAGDVTGLTAVHVNRMIRQLRESDVANIKGKTAFIQIWKRLTKIAEFDPSYLQLHYADDAVEPRATKGAGCMPLGGRRI